MTAISSGVRSINDLRKVCHQLIHTITDSIASAPANPDIDPKDFWLRIDHQTFRKLPKTNAIIFGVSVRLCRWSCHDFESEHFLQSSHPSQAR